MKNPTPTAPEAPKATRQLQNTPINRAFLFLYQGVVREKISIPPITDMSDEEAEQWPMISGREYIQKALDAQIEHEASAVNSHAALEARCAELEGALRKIAGGDTWETIMCDNDGMGCSCVEFATRTLEALAHPHAGPGRKGGGE